MGPVCGWLETALGHLGEGGQHINARLVELAHLQLGHKVVYIATGLGKKSC
jgi:hypothetical protein